MKRTEVTIRRLDSELMTVSGYKCEIEGRPFVVHRSLVLNPLTGEYTLDPDNWTVTEPTTGTSVWCGYEAWDKPSRRYSRAYAIHRADCAIAFAGGIAAVEKHIARWLARFGESTPTQEAQ